jgi:hypothetical protein
MRNTCSIPFSELSEGAGDAKSRGAHEPVRRREVSLHPYHPVPLAELAERLAIDRIGEWWL